MNDSMIDISAHKMHGDQTAYVQTNPVCGALYITKPRHYKRIQSNNEARETPYALAVIGR